MAIGQNLNYIKNVFKHPCGVPDPSVLIETAFAAGAPALLNLVLFGCGDILKMKAGVAPWHTRALKGLVKNATDPKILGPTRFLYASGYGLLEAALWWWLVADTVSGGIADWMSLVYQEQGCQLPGSGHFSAALSSNFQGVGGPYPISINGLSHIPCASISLHSIVIPAGCSATISWDTEFEPFLNFPPNRGNPTTWLEDENGTHISEQDGYPQGKNGNKVTGGGYHARAPFPGGSKSYSLNWRLDQGLMGCTRGNLSVSAYGRAMQLLPAGCKPKLPDQPYPTRPVPPPRPGESQDGWVNRINGALSPPLL